MNTTKANGNRGTILIVDDDPAVLVVIKTILTTAGYRVLLAGEGEDAIRLAGQKHIHIDVALLDVRLPGIHGTQLAGELLSLRPNVRVLFMSGFLDDEIIRIKLLDWNAGFLSKPFKNEGLLHAVQQAMKAPPPDRSVTAAFGASDAVVSCAAGHAG